MRHGESETHHKSHLNLGAADVLEKQQTRVREIVEKLAASLAATERGRDSNGRDVLEPKHRSAALTELERYVNDEAAIRRYANSPTWETPSARR